MRSRRSAYGADGPVEEPGQFRAGADVAPGPARGRGPRRRLRIEALGWRLLAVGCAAAEVALVVWLASGPLLKVRHVSVSGITHLSHEEVVGATGLQGRRSVLTVDGEATRRRIERLAWVRTVSVEPLLPDRVRVSVEEWRPVALYRNGPTGRPFYLNDQGTTLGPSESTGELPLIEGGASADPRVGSRSADPQLLVALTRLQAAFPAIYGQPVGKFNVDCMGALSLTTSRGTRILFGRVLTPEEFGSLSVKLSSLKSIAATDPDVRNPDKIDYINLENEQQPAVRFKADRPAVTAPSPTAVPATSPTARPPAGVPSPAPTPTAAATPAAAPAIEVTTCR